MCYKRTDQHLRAGKRSCKGAFLLCVHKCGPGTPVCDECEESIFSGSGTKCSFDLWPNYCK